MLAVVNEFMLGRHFLATQRSKGSEYSQGLIEASPWLLVLHVKLCTSSEFHGISRLSKGEPFKKRTGTLSFQKMPIRSPLRSPHRTAPSFPAPPASQAARPEPRLGGHPCISRTVFGLASCLYRFPSSSVDVDCSERGTPTFGITAFIFHMSWLRLWCF